MLGSDGALPQGEKETLQELMEREREKEIEWRERDYPIFLQIQ